VVPQVIYRIETKELNYSKDFKFEDLITGEVSNFGVMVANRLHNTKS
jgi:hypothetical protein